MRTEALERVFKYQNQSLPDPGPGLSPREVADHYAALYPELATAAVEGPEFKGNRRVYTFSRAVGTKG